MKVISLVDNISSKSELNSRHGLSFYIETARNKLLFDVGPDDSFMQNAAKLGVDISAVDTAVISHGHYDHGGGLNTFLKVNDKAKVYIDERAFGDYYSLRQNGEYGYIGLDKSLKENSRMIFTHDGFVLNDGLEILSDVDGSRFQASSNKVLKQKADGEFIDDEFLHEQNLVLTENGKTVLFAGCAHSGIINIVDKFLKVKGKAPDYVFGGFHLYNHRTGVCESDGFIFEMGQVMKIYGSVFYTCHCTGEKPFLKLKSILGENLNYFAAGNIVEIK